MKTHSLFGSALACAWLFATPLFSASPAFTSNVSVHDPSIVREGNKYYVFGSHLASASTSDLMNWTQISTSAAAGNALVPNPATEFAETLAWAQTTTFWAPDVIKLADGRFYFYYCACKGDSPRSALGIATADSITGPYKNAGIILKSGMWGLVSPDGKIYDNAIHPNVVDPSVFFDKTGRLWMVYGSYSGGIFIMELDPTTGVPFANQGYGKKLIGGNNTTIEGSYIFYSPESDYYYLLMTYGGLDAAGGYNIRMGRSRSPDGPYVDSAGYDLTKVAGAVGTFFDNVSIAPHAVKLMGNYQFAHVAGEPATTTQGYLSPGGCSVYRDPERGRYLLTFHTRFVGRGEQHEVRVHQLFLNADGWFVASPRRFAQEALSTAKASLIPGDFKVVNHGKDVTSTVKVSTTLTFKSDGTITGAQTGTWSLVGDHYLTLTLASVEYHGVLARLWDDDNQVWVQSFSALSADGVSLWGSKVAATTSNTAPTITQHPASAARVQGQTLTLTVAASATPAVAYQWQKKGVSIPGATQATYTVTAVDFADAGSYTCLVSNDVAAFQSDIAAVTVSAAPAPTLSSQPADTAAGTGEAVNLSVSSPDTGVSYQWIRYDALGTAHDLTGMTGSTLHLGNVTSAEAGSYACRVSNGYTSTTSAAARVTVALSLTNNPDAQLINLSSRTLVKGGANAPIAGFVVSGASGKKLLVRASGPGLAPFGVQGLVDDPALDFFNQTDTQNTLATNEDWGTGDTTGSLTNAFAAAGAFAWPANSKDAALALALEAGNYTAKIRGVTGEGVGLIEVYDIDQANGRLSNLSCRSVVGAGAQAQIAGFVIRGSGYKTLLIRSSGPALDQFHIPGFADDTVLALYDQGDVTTALTVDDDWSATPEHQTAIQDAATKAGAFGWLTGSKDAALLVTLRPGNYSAVATAKNAAGVGLLEVYELY